MTEAMILKNASTESVTLKTTLYDLIESINEELEEDETDLIVEIVSHMLKSTRAKFTGDGELTLFPLPIRLLPQIL